MNTFIPLFETKLKHLKHRVVKELSLPKKERNKKHLKKILKEIRSIKHTVRSVKSPEPMTLRCPSCGHEPIVRCPQCGHELIG